jgi:hypothetical protein
VRSRRQRFGSTANLNIDRYCLALDAIYRRSERELNFREVRALARPAIANGRFLQSGTSALGCERAPVLLRNRYGIKVCARVSSDAGVLN